MVTWPGRPHPLGASPDEDGVNFALHSAHATRVQLCLLEGEDGAREQRVVDLVERTGATWHCHLPGERPGRRYAYRVHGPDEPGAGHRFEPARRLLDPQARLAVPGPEGEWHGVVWQDGFDWRGDRSPRTPWGRTVIYECHVKGLTMLHPDVPPEWRGKYLGLSSEPVVEHLLSLGVTALELMPVMQHAPERHLRERGRTNYWGYSPVSFFAPHAAHAVVPGRQVEELQEMVRRLHAAGLEVIVDVCLGHTVEGGGGPPVSLQGIDAATYFRIDRRGRFVDWTGCGNTLDLSQPATLRLVLDALRHWVGVLHVDGFRFDQAVTLARGRRDFEPEGPFLLTIAQDPVLASVKLIAEPWDLGPVGYRLGGFPDGWSEWNDRFRGDLRSFWLGHGGRLGELCSRLAGSSDVFAGTGRGAEAGVNFVTCHDGFTLWDLVSHQEKHNLANGEQNRDGSDDNRSCNWGVEGATADRRILRRRERSRRALLATLAFSQGVPMLSHGDELGRTQEGNNNAYCHDSELTWVKWELDAADRGFLGYVRDCFSIRSRHAVLRRRSFFHGSAPEDATEKDLTWLRPDGGEMSEADWWDEGRRSVGMRISGSAADWVDERGRPVRGDTLLLLVNGAKRRERFRLPKGRWRALLCSGLSPCRIGADGLAHVPPLALALLERGAS